MTLQPRGEARGDPATVGIQGEEVPGETAPRKWQLPGTGELPGQPPATATATEAVAETVTRGSFKTRASVLWRQPERELWVSMETGSARPACQSGESWGGGRQRRGVPLWVELSRCPLSSSPAGHHREPARPASPLVRHLAACVREHQEVVGEFAQDPGLQAPGGGHDRRQGQLGLPRPVRIRGRAGSCALPGLSLLSL